MRTLQAEAGTYHAAVTLIRMAGLEPCLRPEVNTKEDAMRQALLVIGAAAAAISIAACSKPADQTNAPSALTNAENAAVPSANPDSTVLSTTDVTKAPNFVTLAASSDMFEIESSKVALQRSTNADIKHFAQMMIDAHTKTTKTLKGLIAGAGQNLSPPTALPTDLQSKLDTLSSVSPADFDKTYIQDQIDGHQSALNVMQRYAKDGDVESIKQFAASTAPVVQQHLTMAKKLQDGMNKAANAASNTASNSPT
jgi:putative membrane protein